MRKAVAGIGLAVVTLAACVGDEEVGKVDAGTDAGSGPSSSCAPRDSRPGGCPAGQDYCYESGQTAKCASSNTTDPACTSTAVMRCLGASCGPNRACCLNGIVSEGSACQKRVVVGDTECRPATPGTVPCFDRGQQPITCVGDGECNAIKSGSKCVSVLLEPAKRVIGVCDGI